MRIMGVILAVTVSLVAANMFNRAVADITAAFNLAEEKVK